MTPEERAADIIPTYEGAPIVPDDVHARIAAAIREAVDEETEACAAVICPRCAKGEPATYEQGSYASVWCHGAVGLPRR